jgi:hypothetical protein
MSGRGVACVLTAVLLLGIAALTVRPSSAQEPTVVRDSIWTDTAKFGNMQVRVRGLGTLLSANQAELKIAQSQAVEVQPGQAALVEMQSDHPVPLPGRVTRVDSRVVNGTVTVGVQLDGAAPAPAQPGAALDGAVEIRVINSVVYVGRPVFGAANSEGTLFKLDADGLHASRIKVQYGDMSVNVIQIRAGLQPGDTVILSDMSAYDKLDRIALR